MMTLLILLALLTLLLCRIPVAFALGGIGITLLYCKGFSLSMVPLSLYGSLDNFVLLSVPLFLLMSNILLKAGVGKDLFTAVQCWVGHWPGGLGIATIISCAIFSAISGSSLATAATIGTVAIHEMTERGYDRPFVLGLVAAGGTLGILIPPSIPMIVYGVITEESTSALFLAGIGPGLLLAAGFMLYSFFYGLRHRDRQLLRADWEERGRATLKTLPTICLAGVVIGGIYAGWFTPTESAGIGFSLALLMTLVMGRMNLATLREAVEESMVTTVTLFLIVAGAKLFGKAITLYRIPQEISTFLTTNISEPALFMALICAVLLLMGFFLESMSMLLIMMPVIYPSLSGMGIDPVWFAVVFVIMIECALITPPVGLNLFVIQAVSRAPLAEVIRGVWPFILMLLGSVVLLWFVPKVALYIPFFL